MQAKDHILLVDDEPQVLVALEDLLGEEFTVLTAETGDGALELLERDRDIAVIVTDQRMPRMTGDELLARARRKSGAPSILLTGYADLSAVVRAVNEGRVFAYVTKPWDAPDLRVKVTTAAEHFRLSRTLAHERQLLHDLMDSTPDAVYIKDRDLRFQRVNKSFVRYLGLSEPDLLIGKRLRDAGVEDETCGILEAEERAVVDSGEPRSDLLRRLTFGDKARWFSGTKAPIRDPRGQVVGVVGISRDVSVRVAATEALAENELRFREQNRLLGSILASMGEGVIALGSDGRKLLANARATVLLGADPADIPAKDWPTRLGMYLARDLKTPVPADANIMLRAIEHGESAETEVYVKNQVVEGATIAVTAGPLQDDAGSLAGGIVLLRDVTQQRRLEQQLAQAQKMEAIGVLAGGIAHDFNNLLSVIISCGDLALTSVTGADPVREHLSEMLEASRRASTLTRQLLAFSRKQVVEPSVLDLNAVVGDSEKMLRRILGEDILLEVRLSPSLWRIMGDAGQMDQVVLNLAVNARDAMPDGGMLTIETHDVDLREEYCCRHAGVAPGAYAMLAVTDSGCGMDAETRDRIFEPFFTTKRLGHGTGLGLSTTYGIVTQHGGHIDVYSEPGHGTAFKLYFPRVDATAEPQVRRPSFPRVASERATVLLVEDDEAVRRVACRILKLAGYNVLETRSASSAIDLCRKNETIHLLLTDVVMPEMSGPRLAEEALQVRPGLRTLFMSGYPGGAASRNTSLIPGVAFLPKPFTAASMLEAVRNVLEDRR